MSHYFHYFFSLCTYHFTKFPSSLCPFGDFSEICRGKGGQKTHTNLRPKKGPESGYVSAKASWRRINMQGCSLSTKHQSKKDRESNFVHDTFLRIIVQKVYFRQNSILASNEYKIRKNKITNVIPTFKIDISKVHLFVLILYYFGI